VDYRVIQLPDQSGHPIKTSAPEIWQELEVLLAKDWPCASGGTMPILAMAIDSGFRPQMVYDFAARHPQPAHGPAGDAITAPRTVIPTKGTDNAFKLLASVSSTDAARKRQNIRIWSIGTHWAKQEFYDWLRLGLPTDPDEPFPPGYQHYAYGDDQFYKGLCSETRVVRAASGKIEWVKDPNVRNEPLDTAVLCRAASAVCGIDRFSEEDWAAAEGNVPSDAPRVRNEGYWGAGRDWFGATGREGWFK
jgi:phage terminase large subunit GpA-like protein